MSLDPRLRDYAQTDRQREIFDAVQKHGSHRKAAEAIGISHGSVDRAVSKIKKRAATYGMAPGHWESGVAPGFRMVKVTVTREPDGSTGRVWERQIPEAETIREYCQEIAEELQEDIKPYNAPNLDPNSLDRDIVPWFQIGDAHFGMISYKRETGQNFDLDIAARELRTAFKMLLEKAPPSERCVINDLGDFTHYENFAGVTERGGHALDIDTRFPKMVRIYTRLWREFIEAALERYQTVDIIINQANHSRTNDIWASEYTELFSELIQAKYSHTGRVNVLNNDSVFIGYLMGETFVMTHHSDKCSGEKLVDVMFSDFFDAVKQARHLLVDTGHIHHKQVKKERGIVLVQSWNNLAPNDKHHSEGGWRSKQSMSVAIRSRKYGEIGQHTIPVEMIWDALAEKGEKSSARSRDRHFVA